MEESKEQNVEAITIESRINRINEEEEDEDNDEEKEIEKVIVKDDDERPNVIGPVEIHETPEIMVEIKQENSNEKHDLEKQPDIVDLKEIVEEKEEKKRPHLASMSIENVANNNIDKPSASAQIRISMTATNSIQKSIRFDWFYILPVLYFSIPSIALIFGAITSAYLIPVNPNTFSSVNSGYQVTRIFAIILDIVAFGLTVYVLVAHVTRFLRISEVKFVKFFSEVITMAAIFALIPFNILMIVAEVSLPRSYFNVMINEYAYMLSGVFGLLAIVPLLGLLFFSRLYEFFCLRFRTNTETASETTEI